MQPEENFHKLPPRPPTGLHLFKQPVLPLPHYMNELWAQGQLLHACTGPAISPQVKEIPPTIIPSFLHCQCLAFRTVVLLSIKRMPHHGGTGISPYDSSSNDLCPISLLPFITKLLYLLPLIPLLSLSPGLPGIMLLHSTETCFIQETNNFYFVKSSGQSLVLRNISHHWSCLPLIDFCFK